MGSTGEHERKRRQFSSISPPAKKSMVSPRTEDKKLDAAVLQYQNQKLVQQLEAQNVEYHFLENKLDQMKEKQKCYDRMLEVVDTSWDQVVSDLESLSIQIKERYNDGASSPTKGEFLCRLLKSEATESCSQNCSAGQKNNRGQMVQQKSQNIVENLVSAINNLWHVNDVLSTAVLESLQEDEPTKPLQNSTEKLQAEVKSVRAELDDLYLKHKTLSTELQIQRDTKAKNKSEQKRLAGELESTNVELDEGKRKLAHLKAHSDAGQRAPYLFPNLGTGNSANDKTKDKDKELQDLQCANQELMDLASNRLLDIRRLHENRIETLKQLADLRNTTSSIQRIISSKAFQLLHDQLEKLRVVIDQQCSSFEELQVEKDNFVWRESEVSVKHDLADVSRRASTVAQSRRAELETFLKKLIDERTSLESKLEEASREPGRNEVIAEFKALVSSLPKDIDTVQSQLSKYKEDSSDLHSLRAEVKSLKHIMERKTSELDALSDTFNTQQCDIRRLKSLIQDLKESELELKLFLDIYKRECAYSRDVVECRDSEFKKWAHVHCLQSSLDEHTLELRVKAANEAEAKSQQKLAAAEAEIAELRQKLDATGRDIVKLSEALDSKREQGEAYLSEIESIGQAYEDVQNKNQHLLQQVTERDDYNIKLALEGVKTKQIHNALQREVQTLNWEVQQASTSLNVYNRLFLKLDDQLRIWSEQVGKLAEDGWQSSAALENTKRRLLDLQTESMQLKKSLGEKQDKVDASRLEVSELHMELEKERFNKKRVEEDLEIVTKKAEHLRAPTEKLTLLTKLQQELGEYKGILKCSKCRDRQKEVVIAKCYHLFCNLCVKKTLESRHRKCPACAVSFGPNDVKPIYI